MTGGEFESWIKRLKLKKGAVAQALGVDADTVTACCKAHQVKPLYAYALLGLAAQQRLSDMTELSDMIGFNSAVLPKKTE